MAISQPSNLGNLVTDHKKLLAQPITGGHTLQQLFDKPSRSTLGTNGQLAQQRPPAAHLVRIPRLDLFSTNLQVFKRRGEVCVEEVQRQQADTHWVGTLPDRTTNHCVQLLRIEDPLRRFERQPAPLYLRGVKCRRCGSVDLLHDRC